MNREVFLLSGQITEGHTDEFYIFLSHILLDLVF